MDSLCVEIRAAEGGRDAELLVDDQFSIYVKLAQKKGLSIEITDSVVGFVSFRVTGPRAWDLFKHETGGHRWQRVPPTEKRGRPQTSTVTVACLPEPNETQLVIKPQDLSYVFSRGSGAGGQKRNKTESACDLTHLPTGLVVHCESERSQYQNKASALAVLRSKLWEMQRELENGSRASARKMQLGTGSRGSKTWTASVINDVVTYHPTGQKFRLRDYLAGDYTVM